MTDKKIIPVIERYLKNKDFQPHRLKANSDSKPDFEVEYKNGGIFYCEVKSPDLKLDINEKYYRHQTTLSKLYKFLHKAVKQFKKVNLKHIVPNILIWTSSNFQLNWSNFIDAYRGYLSIDNKTILRDFRGFGSFKNTKKDWKFVDYHIWLQLNNEYKVFEEKHFKSEPNIMSQSLINLLQRNIVK